MKKHKVKITEDEIFFTPEECLKKSIRIGPYDYAIKEVSGFITNAVYGEHNGFDHEILLSVDLSKQMYFSTLIHEILEAINEIHELNLKHSAIRSIETCLAQVLQDNNIYKLSGMEMP